MVLSVTRCDPHAVAEDKKGYLLPVRVSVDGAEAVLVEVAVPVPERAPLAGAHRPDLRLPLSRAPHDRVPDPAQRVQRSTASRTRSSRRARSGQAR